MFVFLIYTVYTCMHDSICKTLITSFPQFCWQLVAIIIHQIFSLARGWFKRVTWLKILQLKLGNIRVILPNFQIYMCCEKYMKDNKHKKLSFGAKICTDICRKTFAMSQSPQFCFLERRSWKTEQIMSVDKYPGIFLRQMEAIVYTWKSYWK